MTTAVSLEGLLQVAIVGALKRDNGVGTADRVFDAIPKNADFPYVNVGEDLVLGDDSECADGSEVISRIHAWSREVGFPELKEIAWNIRQRLRSAALNVPGFRVDNIEFVQSQFLRDPDGQTRHAVLEFRFLVSHL